MRWPWKRRDLKAEGFEEAVRLSHIIPERRIDVRDLPYARMLTVGPTNDRAPTGTTSGAEYDCVIGGSTWQRSKWRLPNPIVIDNRGAGYFVYLSKANWRQCKDQLSVYAHEPRLVWAKLTGNTRIRLKDRRQRRDSQLFGVPTR